MLVRRCEFSSCDEGGLSMFVIRGFRLPAPALLLSAILLFPFQRVRSRTSDARSRAVNTTSWLGGTSNPPIKARRTRHPFAFPRPGSNPPVPITGVEKTLSVQIRQGNNVRTFPLRSVFGQPGYYVTDIVPTRAGNFQWTFVSTVNGDTVNDLFDTADGKFNKVEPIDALQFPVAVGGRQPDRQHREHRPDHRGSLLAGQHRSARD